MLYLLDFSLRLLAFKLGDSDDVALLHGSNRLFWQAISSIEGTTRFINELFVNSFCFLGLVRDDFWRFPASVLVLFLELVLFLLLEDEKFIFLLHRFVEECDRA